mmetsp:Transcript_14719/g.30416  ORF Transcript_14719/g.30416 Transcript_14719/m.30416 type:complete len:214 (-) Transcript_14719:35-676(-)
MKCACFSTMSPVLSNQCFVVVVVFVAATVVVAQKEVPELVREVGGRRNDACCCCCCFSRRARFGRRGRRFRQEPRVDVRQELLEPVVAVQDVPEDLLAQNGTGRRRAGRDQLDHPRTAGVQVADHGPDRLVGADAQAGRRQVGGIQHRFQEVHLFLEDDQVVRDLKVGFRGGGRRRSGGERGGGGHGCGIVLYCIVGMFLSFGEIGFVILDAM